MDGDIVTARVGNGPEEKKNAAHILLLTVVLLLPGTIWGFFGWISMFIPLMIFAFISKYGRQYTNRSLLFAVPLALLAGFLLESLELTLFTVAMLPAGYAAAYSAEHQETPWLAGMKAWIVLGISFFVFFSFLLANSEVSLFQAISQTLNRGFEEALRQYGESDISAENYAILEQTLQQVQTIVPLILPAIFGGILLLVSWITLALGNVVLPRMGCSRPWKEYRYWKLPDKLIWALIVCGIITLLPGSPPRIIAVNALILIALTYSFQGVAILAFFLEKWSMPRYVRTVIYIMVLLQSFGTILLIVAGISDVWFNLRKLDSPDKGSEAG